MYEFLRYLARDFLSAPPVTIGLESTLREAEAVFEARQFNALPVVAKDGTPVGWLTKLDVLKAFRFGAESTLPQYDFIMGLPVRSAMTPLRDAVRVTSRTPLTRVLEKMVRSGVKSMPVVDDDRLIGVIAREDLLRALRRATPSDGSSPTEST